MLYRRAPAWADGVPLGEQPGVRDHLAYLGSRYEEGVVDRAGPFHRLTDLVERDGLVGLVLYRLDVDTAGAYAREDPAVRAGLLEFSVLPWYP